MITSNPPNRLTDFFKVTGIEFYQAKDMFLYDAIEEAKRLLVRETSAPDHQRNWWLKLSSFTVEKLREHLKSVRVEEILKEQKDLHLREQKLLDELVKLKDSHHA